MPCRQITGASPPSYLANAGPLRSGASHKTEAECLQACKEGACCEGTTCSVKPQCQCQGTGKTFKGVGTVCAPNPCYCCCKNGALLYNTNQQSCESNGGEWGACIQSTMPSSIPVTLNLQDEGDNKWSRINGTYTLVKQEGGDNPTWVNSREFADPKIFARILGGCSSPCPQIFVYSLIVLANASIRDIPRNDFSPALVLLDSITPIHGICTNSGGIVGDTFTLGNPLP